MSEYISENRVLTNEEMTNNAIIVHEFLIENGWSEEAIAGLLGNMQSESRINAGAWQGYKKNVKLGYGICQWTPSINVTEWLLLNGYHIDSLDGQLNRLMFEMKNGLQYYKTGAFPLSFTEFSNSTKKPEYLAYAFMNNYERCADRNQPQRQTNARKWYDYFNSEVVASDLYSGIVTGDSVNIREEDSIKSSVVGIVNKGDVVEVVGISGEWVKIQLIKKAYIHKNFIK